MFKNKTEQNRNDEKYNQTGLAVKIHTNHDGVRANVIMLSPSRLARHGDLRTSQWIMPQKLHRPSFEWKKIRACSDILSDALSRRPHHPKRSSCSGEFGCRSFIKNLPWTLCFLFVMWKTYVFLWATIRLKFVNISRSDSVLETKNLPTKVLNSTCRTI